MKEIYILRELAVSMRIIFLLLRNEFNGPILTLQFFHLVWLDCFGKESFRYTKTAMVRYEQSNLALFHELKMMVKRALINRHQFLAYVICHELMLCLADSLDDCLFYDQVSDRNKEPSFYEKLTKIPHFFPSQWHSRRDFEGGWSISETKR